MARVSANISVIVCTKFDNVHLSPKAGRRGGIRNYHMYFFRLFIRLVHLALVLYFRPELKKDFLIKNILANLMRY